MRILYLTQYFPPEIGATQDRAYEMTRHLAAAGHQVTAITEVPNHPSGIIPRSYQGKWFVRERVGAVDVVRTWVMASRYRDFSSRLRFYGSYAAMATLAGLGAARGHYDLVYATSPPLFVGAAGLAVAAVRGVPFVFEVRDLWPESAIQLGFLRNPRVVRWATALEETLYAKARRVVVVTEGIRQRLVERGIDPGKLALIRNGASTRLLHAASRPRAEAKAELGLGGRFVVLYAGIHGLAQGMDKLVRVAERLRGHRRVHFVFVGEGPTKRLVRSMVQTLGLDNVTLLPERPRDAVRVLYDAADAVLVPLRDEPVFRGAVPTKMFDAWACRRPVILSVAGEARQILEDVAGGIAVAPEDIGRIAEAVRYLQGNPDDARQMGEAGHAAVLERFSRGRMAHELERTLRAIHEAAGAT